MLSPFPGMDPYLEDQEWHDFYVTFTTVIRELLQPIIRPRFIAQIERRVQVQGEQRETYIVVCDTGSREVVTVIEILSPSTKQSFSAANSRYLSTRKEMFARNINLVEVDLLRAGPSLPFLHQPVPGDYCALVTRGKPQPSPFLYTWNVRQSLPTLPIPLSATDADVAIDFQQAFSITFERARYDLTIDYSLPLRTPLTPDDDLWQRKVTSDWMDR